VRVVAASAKLRAFVVVVVVGVTLRES